MRRWFALASLALAFAFTGRAADAGGPVTIGGVTYDSVDPGEPFAAAPPPAPDGSAPAPSRTERAAGLLPFVTSDPGDYRPDRVPRPAEHAATLRVALTPGEYEPVWVGVQALADVRGLTVRVETESAPVTVDVRYLHAWPQRTGWKSRRWYMTPELLLPCGAGTKWVPVTRGVLAEQSFDLAAGTTAGLWLTLQAAAAAKPGFHAARVILQGRDRPALELPLHIDVLPFCLQRPPDRAWTLYCDSGRWRTMTDAQVLAEMRDFARHGMTGLIEIGLGTPDLTHLREGRVAYDASTYRRWAQLAAQAGLPGPHVIGSPGAAAVRDVVAPGVDLEHGDWPQAVRDGVAAVARAAMEATRDLPPWYYYGVDEPAGDNTYAIQDYQAWHAGGARTYATFYDIRFVEKAAAYLTAPCFVSGLISREQNARDARDACAKAGAEFWWYGTGSYVNPFPQEGFLWHNRYGAGLLFWKSGAKGEATWTFCRPHEDVFNDFDGGRANGAEPKEQNTVYPHFLKPDDWSTYQGAIPTLAWEALREGVDDYAYLYTLAQAIAEARRRPDAALHRRAAEAEAWLQALVDAVPWANCMDKPAFDTRRLQQVRQAAIGEIVALQAALAGRPAPATATQATAVTLELRTIEPVQAQAEALPVIPVLPAAAAPTIDGRPDDPCWRTAAVPGGFRCADNGAAPVATTEARLLYDARALYALFRCPEPAMDRLVARQQGHDTANVWLDDGVELFVAGPARDPYVHVIVNTNGSVYDERGQDPAWNPAVAVGVHKQADGWCAEIALPWDDLARAGIPRAAVLAVNLCRSRFAGPEPNPHTAWSVPFGGFHVPRRFGVALLQEGPVALADLRLPTLWGRQTVEATLRNLTGAAVKAEVRLGNGPRQTLSLAAGATAGVSLPLDLRQPGPFATDLAWGVAGQPPRTTSLAVTVPEPVTVPKGGGFCSPGESLERTIGVNLAPAERRHARLRVDVIGGQRTRTVDLPAEPGRNQRVGLELRGRATLRTTLVDDDGRPLAAPTEDALVPVPR